MLSVAVSGVGFTGGRGGAVGACKGRGGEVGAPGDAGAGVVDIGACGILITGGTPPEIGGTGGALIIGFGGAGGCEICEGLDDCCGRGG